jgi:hypothetical protein
MKAMTVSLSPDPSPAREEGRFLSRIRDFHIFARAAGRRAATDAIRRALDDGGDATWNPADRPPPAPRLWRAAPPLNLANPGEPLAGKWRTWALADGREMPPLPPLFGSERYWEEAREVLRVARRLSVEQKRVADEWNLDKGSVTPAGVWKASTMAAMRHGTRRIVRRPLRAFGAQHHHSISPIRANRWPANGELGRWLTAGRCRHCRRSSAASATGKKRVRCCG